MASDIRISTHDRGHLSSTSNSPSVQLQDRLIRCQRQLSDWEACPSSKTPEGKKIIENLRAQLGNIESRIQAESTVSEGKPSSNRPSNERMPATPMYGALLSVYA